jgi:hypothetical protein
MYYIYTQYLIITKQKEVFRILCICRNGNITFTEVFRPFTQYFVEAPLAALGEHPDQSHHHLVWQMLGI